MTRLWLLALIVPLAAAAFAIHIHRKSAQQDHLLHVVLDRYYR